MSSNRTKFMELKEGINIGRVKNIWYYSRSRWSRNTIEDLLMIQNYFIPHKVTVFEGENGRKIYQVLQKFSQSISEQEISFFVQNQSVTLE